METVLGNTPRSFVTPGNLVRRAWAFNAPLTLATLAMIPLTLLSLGGLVFDHQIITGVPAWIKPLKFAISTAIYLASFLYLLTHVQGRRRWVSVVANVTALCLIVEDGLIALQVARGTTSHFNYATSLDASIFITMAVFIGMLWTMGIVVAILLLTQRMADPAWAWALRLSMLLALVGMAVAILMTSPSSLQRAALHAGASVHIIGAHTVGLVDGGPGLPFLGWSTVGGDLRVPHFFGLHGLQFMLIIGWLLTLASGWLDLRHRMILVWTAGVSYLGLTMLLTWQALRGQSLVHPDMMTLSALGALAAVAVLLAGGTLLHARSLRENLPTVPIIGGTGEVR